MPKYAQSISPDHTDKETTLAICYQVLKNLNWPILFAGQDKLLGTTPKTWKKNSQQILCTVEENILTTSSEMTGSESFDFGGRNKKNVAAFITAFEAAKNTVTESAIQENKLAIQTLRAVTIKAAEEEQKQAAEVDRAMNLKGSNLHVTYAIMAINAIVFVLMAINGAGLFEANSFVHIKWGSNYTPLTLSRDWWRLITNVFIHFGIIHIAMNMYCLYTVGVYLEPMLGKAKYTAAYICTGILASLVSLWWHKEGTNSAGASGAVFGLYGLFLALLTTNLIPKQIRQPLLQSIGIFIAYNLFYGMKGGVDNAAHIGGLLSGFIIGYIYTYGINKEKQEQKLQWIVPLVVLVTLATAYGYLQNNKVADADRVAALNLVKSSSYKDNDNFDKRLNDFDKLHTQAIAIPNDSDLLDEKLRKKINDTGLPKWTEAEAVINTTKTYDISPESHAKADKVLEYIALHKNELEIIKQMIDAGKEDDLLPQLETVRAKADSVFAMVLKM
jgi:rhomboid protease GluP